MKLRCPRCRERYMKPGDNGLPVLLVNGPIVFSGAECFGQCRKCREPVPLPLAISPSVQTAPGAASPDPST